MTLAQAHLFEMNTLFEEYVGRALQRTLRGDGRGLFAIRPDIALLAGRQVALIVDTKWKRLEVSGKDPRWGVSQADVYQLMAYSQVYRCPEVMLLYPHHNSMSSTDGVVAQYMINGGEGRLTVATIDLADLRLVEERLAGLARGVMSGGARPSLALAQ